MRATGLIPSTTEVTRPFIETFSDMGLFLKERSDLNLEAFRKCDELWQAHNDTNGLCMLSPPDELFFGHLIDQCMNTSI